MTARTPEHEAAESEPEEHIAALTEYVTRCEHYIDGATADQCLRARAAIRFFSKTASKP